MPTDTGVLVPNTGTKKVYTLEATMLQPDGSVAVVEMQAITLRDSNGNVINLDNTQFIADLMTALSNIQLLLAVIAHVPQNAA